MSKNNLERKSCKDVFNAFLVTSATYSSDFEFPCVNSADELPNRLIPFSKAISCKDHNQWVHFYEDDYLFERLWRNPQKYLHILQRYNGVILPDFSLYRDMPLVMQLWNIYRSRAIGSWLCKNGIKVIANIRYGDERTYAISCVGINKNGIIAIGTHGTIKNCSDREVFVKGLDVVVEQLRPKVIVVYGAAPNYIFDKYRLAGIEILQFDSDYALSHRRVV